MRVDDFDFDLPRSLIASHPAVPRDAGRLLVVGREALHDRMIGELPKLLRMSLLTIPLDVSMLVVERLAEFEPSAGKGPLVSVGSSLHALAALEDEPRVSRP